jgi:hypothetical protein
VRSSDAAATASNTALPAYTANRNTRCLDLTVVRPEDHLLASTDVATGGDEGAASGVVSGGVEMDGQEALTWVYPTNKPKREYQQRMAETGLFHNTLICLPTGLGKTLIAAVIMYNFYRCGFLYTSSLDQFSA